MKPVVDVETMRKSDAETIRQGTAGRDLMWRAAKGVFDAVAWKGTTAIVCGSGNNAGDGFALSLLLQEANVACTLLLLSDRFSEDGAYYYEKCKEKGIKIRNFTPQEDASQYARIVDCIFGTGFHGTASGIAADAIEWINQSSKTVISVDINSGLDGDSGLGSPCVRSDLTVSIGFYKNGHFLNQAKDVIKRLVNVDIGIGLHGTCRHLVEASDFSSVLRMRSQNSHKGNYGYVSILGGCTSYSGAVKLAGMSCAALRAGCGVSQLIVPKSLADSVSPYLLESTLALLPDHDGHMLFDPEALDRALAGQRALAVGMGWGRGNDNRAILAHFLKNYTIPTVIDADGLNTLATSGLGLLSETKAQVVLTPHLKEMERLSGIPLQAIMENPIGIAEDFARKWGVILLLKGPTTVVTDGVETVLVDRGCAGMATAGSGDVLSGILVGLLGYNSCNVLTVACGAFIAGRAGELAQAAVNPISMMASDTVANIGRAISEMLTSNGDNC